MSAPASIGDVHEKSWETKKLFDWSFSTPLLIASPLLEKLGPPSATVSIEKRDDNAVFVARSNWFGGVRKHHEGMSDSSLEGLRTKVTQAFRDQIIAHCDVKWEDWIEVKIEGSTTKEWHTEERVRRHGEMDASLHITCKKMKRGRFPDGRDMVLEGYSIEKFPKAKRAGTDTDWRSGHGIYAQDDDAQYAYIRATPENEVALKELMAKMDELNDRLQSVLGQNSIGETVKLLAGGQLRLEKK